MRKSVRLYFLLFVALIATAGAVFAAAPPLLAPKWKPPPSNAGLFMRDFVSIVSHDPPVPAPPLTFHSLDGSTVKLDEFKGKWRLINFWATWCGACVTELPSLVGLQNARRESGLDVMFVSLDNVASARDLKKRMQKTKLPEGFETFYVLDSGVWNELKVDSLPTTIILDPEGRLRYKLVGDTDWMAKESLEFIDDLINN